MDCWKNYFLTMVAFISLLASSGYCAEVEEEAPATYPVIPIAFYSDETGLAGGAMVMTAFEQDDPTLRPDSLKMLGYYTTEDQYSISVNPDLYFDSGFYYLNVVASVSETPSVFWGVGEAAGDGDSDEEYTESSWGLSLESTVAVYGPLRAGITAILQDISISDKEQNRIIASGGLIGSDGGKESGAGVVLVWDDRDSTFWPTEGGYHRVRNIFYKDGLGSDFDYTFIDVDARYYLQFDFGGVFAFRGVGSRASKGAPFFSLPQLGGADTMRGLYQGRYRDNYMSAVQVEYRRYFSERFGWVAFASLGAIGNDMGDLFDSTPLVAGGGGLRFALDPKNKINLRFDIGVSKHGIAPMIMINEAF